ncbi:hypothetical protein E2C01_014060 [Portunus trituberculatus]|uniref:Uncharacterized protein n=1 Tax=Portunus trituberculatus TaxID=210409 RepID=A0A5B7DIR8_PORTR|nr:hypothetical protein [Portunus trituberculatus]
MVLSFSFPDKRPFKLSRLHELPPDAPRHTNPRHISLLHALRCKGVCCLSRTKQHNLHNHHHHHRHCRCLLPACQTDKAPTTHHQLPSTKPCP